MSEKIKKDRKIVDFNPASLLENFASSGLDASIFESLDESQFTKAPNIVEFATSPMYLNATLLPKQIQMGAKLFAEYCPICSDNEFFESLLGQDLGTIKEKIVFLEHGVCPSCNATRWELIQRGQLNDYNEFAGCLGQRCIPEDSLVFSNRGITKMKDMEVGDIVSHGYVYKKFDSGKLKIKTLKTSIGWELKGSATSHIVPVIDENGIVTNKEISKIGKGEYVLLVSPDLWPAMDVRIPNEHTEWPEKLNIPLASLLGLLCRNYTIENDSTVVFNNENVEVILDMFIELFGFVPRIIENKIVVVNQKFVSWFKIFTKEKQIPEVIARGTKEVVQYFMFNFLSTDWLDESVLRIDANDIEDLETFKLLLLNLGILVMKMDDKICNVHIETENEKFNNLVSKGIYPVMVTDIYDGEEVQMYDISVPNTNVYVADGFLHHNSGKSKFIGIVANYVLHRFLCMPNPIRTFNQSAGDILNMSFAGLSEDKVEKNLWGPFIGFMDASPWFQRYHAFLDEKGKELKKPLFVKRTTFVEYFHKKILIDFYGSHGDTMRGDTRIFASADEIAFMGSGAESKGSSVMNADAIYTSLNNSLATMRMKRRQIFNEKNFDLPPILIANISSPSSTKDKIMKQVKASKTNPAIYGVHAATWECNSDYTEESLLLEYASEDPAEFYRNFGAQPPIESNPFLSETASIDRIAIGEVNSLYGFSIEHDKDALGDDFVYGKLVINNQDKSTPRLIAFDLGSTKNAFGVSIFKLDSEARVIFEDGLIIKPSKKYKIHLPWIFQHLTVPLLENYNVKYVFFDKWQSLDQVTRIREKGINAQIYSLKYNDMDDVRGRIRNRGVIIPKLSKPMTKFKQDWEMNDDILFSEISANLGIQLLTARDLGNRMVKPAHGDDDLFRSFCLGVCALSSIKIIEDMKNSKPAQTYTGAIGVTKSLGGGGSATVGAGSNIGIIMTRGKR